MMPAGRGREKDLARFVYVTSFGSHQCGGVLELGGRQASGHRFSQPSCQLASQSLVSAPVSCVAALGWGRRSLLIYFRGWSTKKEADAEIRVEIIQRQERRDYCMNLTQKDAAKAFDFPIQLPKACKIMRKRKKASVWNSVYKVISRMLEENEKYRLRL
ncbi:hypothetical protein GW7_17129, partial [Heterocephalus glaber]